ncbi:MAG TPA: lipid-binding SYLF domain-containing protein [Phycisphaerae bacterium]|nr:lipid-binding SYLF domain-containing protein [Phycisphaerae bacterium]
MKLHVLTFLTLGLAMLVSGSGFGTTTTQPSNQDQQTVLGDKVNETINQFKTANPDIKFFFNNAYGYAVFPSVGSGAVVVGAAYGNGEVFENGLLGADLTGYCSVTQGSVGAQIGGQVFSEIIFFENKEAYEQFTSGQFTFDARASAVAVNAGAAAAADYQHGVAVFTMSQAGLMVQAAIGGQSFSFTSK